MSRCRSPKQIDIVHTYIPSTLHNNIYLRNPDIKAIKHLHYRIYTSNFVQLWWCFMMYPNPMGEICVEIIINMHLVVIYFWKYLRNSDIILNFSSHEKRRYGDQAYKIVPKKVNVAILFFKFINPTVQNSKL